MDFLFNYFKMSSFPHDPSYFIWSVVSNFILAPLILILAEINSLVYFFHPGLSGVMTPCGVVGGYQNIVGMYRLHSRNTNSHRYDNLKVIKIVCLVLSIFYHTLFNS
jgi:hypothetical protein